MARSTTIYLLRHAQSTANTKGILAGRDNEIGLSELGKQQAELVATFLAGKKLDRILTSPLKRCRETIAPFITSMGTAKRIKPSSSRAFIEMDYGQWSGKKLALLSKKSAWSSIQRSPSRFRFPEGESFEEMRARAIAGIEELAEQGGTSLIVSHGDVIKVIIAHYLAMAPDAFQRLTIDPASISRIDFHPDAIRVPVINDRSHLTSPSIQKDDRGRRSALDLGGGAGPQ